VGGVGTDRLLLRHGVADEVVVVVVGVVGGCWGSGFGHPYGMC